MRSMFRRPAKGSLVLAAAVAGSLVLAAGVRPSAAQQQFLQQLGQTGATAVKKVLGGQPSNQPAGPASGQSASPAGVPPSGSPASASPANNPPANNPPANNPPASGSPPGGIIGRVEQVGQAAATKFGGQKAGNAVQTAGRVVSGARTVVQKVRSKGKPAASSPSPSQPAAPQPQPFQSSPAAPPPPPPQPAGPRPPGAPPP